MTTSNPVPPGRQHGPTAALNLSLGLALAFLLGTTSISAAAPTCSCAGFPSVLTAFGWADAVFAGRVVSREEPAPRRILYQGDSVYVISSGDMIRWRVAVSRGWKGDLSDTLDIYSERSEASCGYGFSTGESYLVYAYVLSQDWLTGRAWPVGTEFPVIAAGLCTRTRTLDHAGEDIAELGEPTWPPRTYSLAQNRPNPFNPATQIRFDLPRLSRVDLSVYDAAGRLVRTLLSGTMPAGPHFVGWDGRDEAGFSRASGVYFYELRAGPYIDRRKMTLLR